jgi:uncharacterized protein YkwD
LSPAATRAILANMHKAIRCAVLSIVPLLLIMANPRTGAHAARPDSRIGAAVAAPAKPSLAVSAGGYTYTVQPSDTLWDIAAAHGISVSSLIAANELADPGMLRPGQKLWVPAPPPKRAQGAATTADSEAASGSAAGAPATEASPPANPGDSTLPSGKEQWPTELLSLINDRRGAAALPLLTLSPELSRAAQAHAEDCARRNRGGHAGSDGALLDARIERQGTVMRYSSENWAYAQSVRQAFALWWNEEPGLDPHRRNILDPRYTEIGIGVANAPWGTYFVADFGGR